MNRRRVGESSFRVWEFKVENSKFGKFSNIHQIAVAISELNRSAMPPNRYNRQTV